MKTTRLLTSFIAALAAIFLCQNLKSAQAPDLDCPQFINITHQVGELVTGDFDTASLTGLTSKTIAVEDVDDDDGPDLITVDPADTHLQMAVGFLRVNLDNGNGTLLNRKPFQVPRRSLALTFASLDGNGRAEGVSLGFGRRGFTITQFAGTGATLSMASQPNLSTKDSFSHGGFAAPLALFQQGLVSGRKLRRRRVTGRRIRSRFSRPHPGEVPADFLKPLSKSLPERFVRYALIGMCTLSGMWSAPAEAAAPTFDDPFTVTTTHRADNMVMGDFDGDGTPDMALLDGNSGDVQVRFGNGSGAFRSAAASFASTVMNTKFNAMAAGVVYGHQVNGNGNYLSDLVFTLGSSVQVWEFNTASSPTNPTFQQIGSIGLLSTNINATKAAVGDLSGVGHNDIVVSDNNGNVGIVVIPNDGTGTFGTPVAYAAKGCDLYAKPIVAHVNEATEDGFGDVTLSHNFFVGGTLKAGVGVLTNKGADMTDGHWLGLNAEVNYMDSAQTALVGNGLAVADVDDDGHLDLVTVGSVAGPSPTFTPKWYLSVNLGAGDGTFADGKPFQFVLNDGDKLIDRPVIDAADLDGDGRPEVVTIIDAPGTMTSNPIQGFTVTRFMGTGANLALEGQDNYPADFKPYDSIALGYTDANGDFVTFNNDSQVDVILGTAVTILSPSPAHSQFLVYQNTTPAAPEPLDPPTLTINGTTTPSTITPGLSVAFASTETSTPLGIYVRIQASVQKNGTDQPTEESWTDLETGNNGHMIRTGGTGTNFTLNTAAYPIGTYIYFRAIAAAPGYIDATSDEIGPFDIKAALSIVLKATTTSDPVNGKVVRAGETITYTLTYAEAAGAPNAQKVQIVDLLPVFKGKSDLDQQVTVLASDITGGGQFDDNAVDLHGNRATAIRWNVGDVKAGDPAKSVSFQVRVGQKDPSGKKINVARLNSSIFNTVYSIASTAGQPQQRADGNGAPVAIAVQPPSGQLFSIEAVSDPVPTVQNHDIGLGVEIRYTLNFSNDGSVAAQNVIVSSDIPVGTTFSGANSDAGYELNGNKSVRWLIPSLPAFQSGSRTFVVIVNSDAKPGLLLAGTCAISSGKISDSDRLPEFSVVTPVKITTKAAPASGPTGTQTHRGDMITYTLSYENVTQSNFALAKLSSDIPKHTKVFKDADGKADATSWPLATLAPGEKGTRTFRVVVDDKIELNEDVTGSAHFDSKAIKFDVPLPNVTVRNPLQIALTPVLIPNPLRPGDGFILQFACTNASSFAMNNVTINEGLPTFTHLLQATDGGAIDPSTGALIWHLGTLQPGEQRVVSFELTLDYDAALGATLYNGNPSFSQKVIFGPDQPVDINVAIGRNGFQVTADDPRTSKTTTDFIATGGSPFSFQVSNVPASTAPILALAQSAVADGNLQQANTTTDLSPEELGDIATVVMPPSPADGLNGQIMYLFEYKNTGTATAHHLRLDINLPADTTLSGEYFVGPDDQNLAPLPNGSVAPPVRNILTYVIGDLNAGQSQIFALKVNVNSKRTSGLIGCHNSLLYADDFFAATNVSPDTLNCAVVPPVTFETDIIGDFGDLHTGPGKTAHYKVTYRNNGGVPASNVQITCAVPVGATISPSSTLPGTLAKGVATFSDPNPVPAQQEHTFEMVFNVANVPDNTVSTPQPMASGKYVRPVTSLAFPGAPAPRAASPRLAGAPPSVLAELSVGAPEFTRYLPPIPARLVIARRVNRSSVNPGDYLVYEFIFGDSGYADAHDVTLTANVPKGTKLADDLVDGSGNHADAVWSGRLIAPGGQAANLPHNFKSSAKKVTWNLGTLAAHAGGTVRMVVKVDPNFDECAVQDNSCIISASDAPSRTPGPISTNVRIDNLNFFGSLWRNVGCFFEGVGAAIDRVLHNQQAINDFQSLSDDASATTIGGSDVVATRSLNGAAGAYTLPLGGGQVLVIEAGKLITSDGAGIIATGGGNVISNDGGSLIGHDGASLITSDGAGLITSDGAGIVAAGAGNVITINGIDGSNGGNLLASNLLANCDQIVASGGGNIVLARGGNLITSDGAGVVGTGGSSLLANDGSGFVMRNNAAVVLNLNMAGIVASGGGNIVASGGGNIVATGGGNIGGRAFGSVLAVGGQNGIVSAGAGNIISHDGGTLKDQVGK